MIHNNIFTVLVATILSCPIFASYPWYFLHHGIDSAHDQNIFGDGIRIAILDTHVVLEHPSLKSANIHTERCDVIIDDFASTHGTAVTSIIGGKDHVDIADFVGVAKNSTIATFSVPEKNCGVVQLERALLKIKDFAPHIVNVSSNVLRLSDDRIKQLFEEMLTDNPSLIIVVAAGNDAAALGNGSVSCQELSDCNANTQSELEQLADHEFKENFVMVGNLARTKDIDYGDLLLLPDSDSDRMRSDFNFASGFYSLSRRILATDAIAIVKAYSQNSAPSRDYFSSFHALHTYLLSEKFSANDDTILFYGGKFPFDRDISSDSFIRWDTMMNSKIGNYEDDHVRIEREVANKMSMRDLKRDLEVKRLKRELGRKEMSEEIAKLHLVKNDHFTAMSELFVDGLPNKNSQLLRLARDFMPIDFNQKIVLNPSSARAAALSSIFLSAFGTNIPAASFTFAHDDVKKTKPLFTIANFTGTSFAAPIVSGAIALVAQACKVTAKEALGKIYSGAEKHNRFEIFGHGKLNIKTTIERCLLQ